MKHHRHRIIGMMQHTDFIEAVPVVKSHRIGIGWNQAHLRGDWTVVLLRMSDDPLVEIGTNPTIPMVFGDCDSVDIEERIVMLIEPGIVEAPIPGLGWQTDYEAQQLVSFAGAEREFGENQQIGDSFL